MIALGTPVRPEVVDAVRIRRTFAGVLGEPRILGMPPQGDEERRAHTAGVLRGHLWVLLRVLDDDLPALHGATRATAEHVMLEARCLLTVRYAHARTPDGLLDLALMSRSLLALHELAPRGD
jgi:hypothetical protein